MSDEKNIAFATVLPDGNGGFSACPELLTSDEAVRYLRLDKQKANAAKTLQYYREQKKLKATKIGKNLFYSRKSLDKFIEELTN